MKSDILDMYLITAKSFIEPKTAVIYDFSCDPPEVFSGTFARRDDKFFVITCAHSMKYMKKEDIRIQRKMGIITLNDLLIPTEVKTLNINHSLDIGIIFLNKEDVKDIEDNFLDIYELIDFRVEHKKEEVSVVSGYPQELVEIDENTDSITAIGVTYLTTSCDKITPNSTEIYLDYPETGNQIFDPQNVLNLGNDLPNPVGMSGGGIWSLDVNKDQNQLWKMDDIKLIGIQISWMTEERYLIGLRINIWFDNFTSLIH